MYTNGNASSYRDWVGKYANCKFDYFARHDKGKPIKYHFNNHGYRGPEPYAQPDITIFGSSFSFGVGIEYDQCWHQLLGNYRINCFSPAGFLVTNDDIIDNYQTHCPQGRVILQLREYRYNRSHLDIPGNVMVFAVDESAWPGVLTFTWSSFVDKGEDGLHPGTKTHKLWAQIIKKKFDL